MQWYFPFFFFFKHSYCFESQPSSCLSLWALLLWWRPHSVRQWPSVASNKHRQLCQGTRPIKGGERGHATLVPTLALSATATRVELSLEAHPIPFVSQEGGGVQACLFSTLEEGESSKPANAVGAGGWAVFFSFFFFFLQLLLSYLSARGQQMWIANAGRGNGALKEPSHPSHLAALTLSQVSWQSISPVLTRAMDPMDSEVSEGLQGLRGAENRQFTITWKG